jgi:Uma2 family endonuclease
VSGPSTTVDRSPVPVTDAILAVEVISPDSTFRDMRDKARVYAAARIPTYWVIDPLHERITLTELRLADSGDYEVGVQTSEVFMTDRPWPVTLNLPVLTERRRALLDRAGGEEN